MCKCAICLCDALWVDVVAIECWMVMCRLLATCNALCIAQAIQVATTWKINNYIKVFNKLWFESHRKSDGSRCAISMLMDLDMWETQKTVCNNFESHSCMRVWILWAGFDWIERHHFRCRKRLKSILICSHRAITFNWFLRPAGRQAEAVRISKTKLFAEVLSFLIAPIGNT